MLTTSLVPCSPGSTRPKGNRLSVARPTIAGSGGRSSLRPRTLPPRTTLPAELTAGRAAAGSRPDGGGFPVQRDAEPLLHRCGDPVGEGEQLGGGRAVGGRERQAVPRRRPDPAVAGAPA